jgi:hypothetical protein
MENPNDTIEIRTRDLPAPSTVRQPTATPRSGSWISDGKFSVVRSPLPLSYRTFIIYLFPTNCTMDFNAATCFDCRLQPTSGVYTYCVLYNMMSNINGKICIHISVVTWTCIIIKVVFKLWHKRNIKCTQNVVSNHLVTEDFSELCSRPETCIYF